MKKWGRNRNIIFAKQDMNASDLQKLISEHHDAFLKGTVSITLTGEEPGTWEKMIEINRLTTCKLQGADREYDLNFKNRQYFCDGEPFYMTDSEARACYFMLVSDVVIDNFGDTAMNMQRRLGKSRNILGELHDGNLTVVEKKC